MDSVIKAYTEELKSVATIAQENGVSRNKIMRILKKNNIHLRNRKEAQEVAKKCGRAPSRKGITISQETKDKISESAAKRWANMTPEQRKSRSEKGKKQWAAMSLQEKETLQKLAHQAIRRAATEGSKVEKFLQEKLKECGFNVEYHKQDILPNDKLQIDLFLPAYNLAIEADGIQHFEPIWGEQGFKADIKSVQHKNGLLMGLGITILRIKYTHKTVSSKTLRDIWQALIAKVNELIKNPPTQAKVIELEIK